MDNKNKNIDNIACAWGLLNPQSNFLVNLFFTKIIMTMYILQ